MRLTQLIFLRRFSTFGGLQPERKSNVTTAGAKVCLDALPMKP